MDTSYKKIVPIVTCTALILGLAAPAAAAEADALSDVVPDPVLRAVINQTLSTEEAPRADDAPISAEDMKQLVGSDAAEIDAAEDDALFDLKGLCSDNLDYLEQDPVSLNPSHGIHSLEGMQYAVNLKSLDLSENSITDLSPLAGLENLTYLELDRNNITDLAPLSGLTGLEHLNLYNNLIYDITPLSTLDQVNWFDLHYANRGAAHLPIDALAGMTALEYISIESNDLVNEDMAALAGLQNLNYIKLNANHITDLTAISSYLDGIMAGDACRIEANNQSLPDWEPAVVQAQPSGGDVTLTVPAVTGIDALYREPSDWSISPAIEAEMDQAVEGVSVDFQTDDDGYPIPDQATFTFENRTYGSALREQGDLCLTYAVTAMDFETFTETLPFVYTLYLPVELRQDPLYQAELSWEGNSSFSIIDTAAGAEASTPLTIRLNATSGDPVELSEVSSIQFFVAGKAYDAPVEGLEAQNITVDGNTISFQVALTQEAPFSGAQYITPVVEYLRTGSDAPETIQRDTLSFHLFAGDASAFQVDDVIQFDSGTAENGSITSRPVRLSIPGETISFVDLRDEFENILASGKKQEDGSYCFTVKQEDLAQIDHFLISADQFLYPEVRGELVTPPSGGGSSSGSGDKTQITTNPDGSTTTTVTSPDGTVTETTKKPDGSKEVVETTKDGKVTTTTTDTAGTKTQVIVQPDGSSSTTVKHADGSSSATSVHADGMVKSEVTLSAKAVEAQKEAVPLPMPALSATFDREQAPAVTVKLPGSGAVPVEIPVSNVTAGTVAMLVKSDGTEEIIKRSLTTETGVAVALTNGDTVKIVENSKHFLDVDTSYWWADAVAFASSRELFSGTGKETFSPDAPMDRAMIVTVLARLEGIDTSAGATWYEAGAQWATANGISDGSHLDAVLTREQLAAMLWRYAGSPAPQGALSGFRDCEDVSVWASDAMSWAVDAGLISGTDSSTLAPQGKATRAQVAMMLMRFVEYMAP